MMVRWGVDIPVTILALYSITKGSIKEILSALSLFYFNNSFGTSNWLWFATLQGCIVFVVLYSLSCTLSIIMTLNTWLIVFLDVERVLWSTWCCTVLVALLFTLNDWFPIGMSMMMSLHCCVMCCYTSGESKTTILCLTHCFILNLSFLLYLFVCM